MAVVRNPTIGNDESFGPKGGGGSSGGAGAVSAAPLPEAIYIGPKAAAEPEALPDQKITVDAAVQDRRLRTRAGATSKKTAPVAGIKI